MQRRDWWKALLFGAGILIADLAIATLAVFAYAWMIDPGHPADFYHEAAPRVATWSTRIAGPLIFFLASWRLGLRHPERSPIVFAVALFAAYLLIDLAIIQFRGLANPVFLATMALKLVGAIAGGIAARTGLGRPLA